MDFPSNSHKQLADEAKTSSAPEKKIKRLTTGEVVRRKKPLGRRFAETFIGGDARGVWNYVVLDVLIPAAKDMIADATTTGIERMVFGESRHASRRPSQRGGKPGGYVSYNRFGPSSESSRREESRPVSQRARATHNFDEIILPTRVEADEVIDQLFEIVSKYEIVTVADLYQMVGIVGSYTDEKWGWTDIRGAGVTRIRNGYLLDLPKPEPID